MNRPGQGRPRKPNELLEALDSRNAKAGVIESEEMVLPYIPPGHLSDVEKAHWLRIVPPLVTQGIAKEADREPLAVLCFLLARLYDSKVDSDGEPLVSEKGRAQISKQVFEIFNQFGMNPTSRSRSGISKKTPGIKVRGK